MSLSRRFRFSERHSFQLRVEAFNALNHTNFDGPNVSLTVAVDAQGRPFLNSPNFGLITVARPARFLQLVGRFEF